jgi:hypothetical protein
MMTQLTLPSLHSRLLEILSVTAAAWDVATWPPVHPQASRAGGADQGLSHLRIGDRKPTNKRPAPVRRRPALHHDAWPNTASHGLRWTS